MDALEMAAAKAMLDHIHADLPADPSMNDTNAYVLESLNRLPMAPRETVKRNLDPIDGVDGILDQILSP